MQKPKAGRLFWEALVVVGSILTAFALDAWWDAQAARSDLRRELESVAQELDGNRAALAERLDGHENLVRSIEEMLRQIEARGSRSEVEFADSIMYRAFVTSPTTDPSTGGLDALIASGRIALLRDAELRRFLAGFRNVVEDMREDELGARAVAHDKIFPLFDGTAAGEAAADSPLLPGNMKATSSLVRFDESTWTRVRSNLSLRRFWLRAAIEEGNTFQSQIHDASDALRAEIEAIR